MTFAQWGEAVTWFQQHYQCSWPMAEWEVLRLQSMSEEDWESGNWPARIVPLPQEKP